MHAEQILVRSSVVFPDRDIQGAGIPGPTEWNHSIQGSFFQYYDTESRTERSIRRFSAYRDIVLRFHSRGSSRLDVADIGCGAGTQSLVWARLGHRIHGLDISEQFVLLARERAAENGHRVEFQVGSATELPWPDRSMDVSLAVELLEHVTDWRKCLDEFTRVLRPNGLLFLTTTNALCPKQQEFDLPLYSWYPKPLKRYFEVLARTTRPELATFATYPAVNWFTPYGLRRELEQRGCRCLDRLDVSDPSTKSGLKRIALRVARGSAVSRFLAHVVTPSTWLLAIKE